jgi:hypothetical protein
MAFLPRVSGRVPCATRFASYGIAFVRMLLYKYAGAMVTRASDPAALFVGPWINRGLAVRRPQCAANWVFI